MSRTTCRSSKGTVRSRRVWLVSCPLPAMTTATPGCAISRARAMASRRSTMDRTSAPRPAGHSPAHLFDDGLGRLAARVVRGHDHGVGEPRGHRTHERALGAVAIAPAAEDRDDPLGPQLPDGLQEVLERVVGVGVVHDDREVLARVHALEPPGDAGEARRGRRPLTFPGMPRARVAPERAQQVRDVEAAEQGRVDLDRAQGSPCHEAAPLQGETNVVGVDVRRARAPAPACRGEAVGPDRGPRGGTKLGRAVVVGVDDRPSVLAEEGVEEVALGFEVAVHVAVEVEVVAGQVREDRDREAATVHALQLQRVRGDLEHRVAAARVHHLAEERLEVRGLGSGAHGRGQAVSDAVVDRAHEPDLLAGRPQDRVDEVGGRGLAVRARDPDEAELLRRVAEGRGREDGQGLAARPRPAPRGLPAAAAPRTRSRRHPSCGPGRRTGCRR